MFDSKFNLAVRLLIALIFDAQTSYYHILRIIRGEKVLLFHILTFIPEKHLLLPAFTSFHSTHVQKNPKKVLRLQST